LHKARLKVRQLLANRQRPEAKPLKTRPRLTSHLRFQVEGLAVGNKA
jgi:hypothetical protein